MAREQLRWTRKEVILAMDFYITVGALTGGPIPGEGTAKIIQLSDLLVGQSLSRSHQQLHGQRFQEVTDSF